ncbi:MAG: TIM barrel protein [Oscillospiraceae bacterium]|nr:TIM barrel protein [Oscillospiraceae bacterium]
MWKQKLGVSVSKQFSLPPAELMTLLREVGFHAISPRWYEGYPMEETAIACQKEGLAIQSLHAPFQKANLLWNDKEEDSAIPLHDLMGTLEDCRRYDVPVMVAHAWITFDYDQVPNEAGFRNFDRVVEQAEKWGVKLALENTEGREFLDALMERYENTDTVGFCWDSGHEICYNHNEDMLALYGKKLYMTHLNDNVGIRSLEGIISPYDDAHLLPYDGIADWDEKIARLKRAPRQEILNLEINNFSRSGRHDNDRYGKMTLEEYFTEAYLRACRIALRYHQ